MCQYSTQITIFNINVAQMICLCICNLVNIRMFISKQIIIQNSNIFKHAL